MLSKIEQWLSGKKTYIVAIATGMLGLYQAMHPGFVMPEWVWALLGALGLGAIRSGMGSKPLEVK